MDICWIFRILYLVAMSTGAPVTNLDQARDFLMKYVYGGSEHPDDSMHDMSNPDTMKRGLQHYQINMGLEITGILDNATMEMMSLPRCGMPDVLTKRDIMRRRKRYTYAGFRWNSGNLTYRFKKSSSYTEDLSDADVERIIAQALKMWSDVADLNFHRVESNDPAVIDIQFATGNHGDDEPFDGPSGTLAHAFFPNSNPIGGDAHFDDDEEFTDGVNSGINLLFVAVHEFGHSLGLGHSDVQSAIMFPTYLGYRRGLALDPDDIAGIRFLYGERTKPATPSTTTTTVEAEVTTLSSESSSLVGPNSEASIANFCSLGTVDAIGTLRGNIYVFQGSAYARLATRQGIAIGYPRRIQEDWPRLFDNVDAVLDNPNVMDPRQDSLLIFKDDRVWDFTQSDDGQFLLTTGYPKQINDSIRGLPNSIDAAIQWGPNGLSYVFKGDLYYRLKRDLSGVVRSYPRSIDSWSLPQEQMTASFTAPTRQTYFFYGTTYVRYDDNNMKPIATGPLESRSMWFACPDEVPDEMEMEQSTDPIPGVDPDVTDASDRGASGSFWTVLFMGLHLILVS